ncbi:MAG TPA: SOS response-associated peptidase [Nocardioidaceae bacterium]|nr:SOS response-associated peptidase [Nocardioidaceae bacterium]
MCGRYASTRSRDDLVETFDIDLASAEEVPERDYNVAPTKSSPVVLARRPRGSADDAEPVRQLRNLTWGLVPSWSKQPKLGRMINARAETVHEKPAFRRGFASRRLIVPSSGFYEWFQTEQVGRSGKPLKQPFYLHPKNDDVLALAGLYEFWRDDQKPSGDPGAWLTTFTIITTRATDDVGHVHDRMPMTVARGDWEEWLDPRISDVDHLRTLMAPPPAGSLEIYPVTTAVNKADNNGPELVEPLAAEPPAPA